MSSSSSVNSFRTCLATIVVGTVLLYAQVRTFDFTIYDDDQYVARNTDVQSGLTWPGVQRAFTGTLMGNWHPVTLISHMLDCTFFGLAPGMHHLTNVALHTANSCLLLLLLYRLTNALWRSAVVAALFAWHPLHVESVAWIAERKDVLSVFFGLLALLAFVHCLRDSRKPSQPCLQPDWSIVRSGYYWLALFLFALALMSKPMLVTFPFLLLLIDFWPLHRLEITARLNQPASARSTLHVLIRLITEKSPFILLATALSVITFFAQRSWGTMGHVKELMWSDRLANALVSYARYLAKTVWPIGLTAHYPHPGTWPLTTVTFAALLLAGISLLTLIAFRKRPWLLMGWFWFIGTLIPVIGLVQVGTQAMADRYCYLPHIGLFLAIVWSGAEWKRDGRLSRQLGWAAVALALGGCWFLSWKQISHWRNSVTLFAHAVQVTPENPLAHYNYAVSSGYAGNEKDMVAHYEATLRLDPDYFSANVNLGHYHYLAGHLSQATNYLAHAVQLIPTNAVANYWCGRAFEDSGVLTAAQERLAAAVSEQQDSAEYRIAYARVLQADGDYDTAIAQLEAAIPLGENTSLIHGRLAALLTLRGRGVEAVAHHRAVLAEQPDAVETLNNLAWILATHPDSAVRDGAEAVRLAEHACELTEQRQPQLLGTLAAAYAEAGNFEAAKQIAQKAIALAEANQELRLVERNRDLLRLYEKSLPYHEPK